MTKTHAELTPEFLKAAMDCNRQLQQHKDFLKQLENYAKGMIDYTEEHCEPFLDAHAEGSRDAYLDIWHKIEQFQAEQNLCEK